MSSLPPELDQLIHALSSPLTTLQGSAQLLRRRLTQGGLAQHALLLEAMERSIVRLRRACDLIVSYARIEPEHVRIEIPFAALSQLARPSLPLAPATYPVAAPPVLAPDQVLATQIVLIAAAEGLPLPVVTMLEARGHHIALATDAASGLDLTRLLRPGLVLVDPSAAGDLSTALQILREDPDTKMIPLALLGRLTGFDYGSLPITLLPVDATEATNQTERLIQTGLLGRSNQPHILIVDDEPDIAEVIALQLADEGYQTTQVYSGTEVLQLVRRQPFDLILLDLLLPDLDGFTVLGGLRAQPETQLTPIILVSAVNAPSDKVRGFQIGADDYITKPFRADELRARVQAALRRSEREGGANPSTRLPGNIAIERAISQRIAQGLSFVVCYCDIDNFKAYNDTYGFLKGDAVIQRTAQILLDAVRLHGNPDDFVGHIGGDDFVVISTPERVAAISAAATARFDATAPLLYDPQVRARGILNGLDRQGRPTEFPLVSITITAVSSDYEPFRHPGEVAQRSVEIKKRGKRIPGSIYLSEG
ncbi:MAG: response regulator [Oscillochloridaceae bacterium umkhey_bin13]